MSIPKPNQLFCKCVVSEARWDLFRDFKAKITEILIIKWSSASNKERNSHSFFCICIFPNPHNLLILLSVIVFLSATWTVYSNKLHVQTLMTVLFTIHLQFFHAATSTNTFLQFLYCNFRMRMRSDWRKGHDLTGNDGRKDKSDMALLFPLTVRINKRVLIGIPVRVNIRIQVWVLDFIQK